ncbi:hypothetical protein [Hyphococcus sp.]|uniref:hypothetical protein n=1 Tax=Hyphococcus sp. TaxID=2038636 RepID=UPI002089338F|nr:MAG: hypothetical protein DHS20C04_25620 [Marinicaulis sp.]
MKLWIVAAGLALMTGPALATAPNSVPEMDVGAGFAAIALLAGVAAVIRERTKRK